MLSVPGEWFSPLTDNMAVTATLFTLNGRAFPFIGIGPSAQIISAIPSAEVSFSIVTGAITIAAAGLGQSLVVNCTLPRSFCYVLVECSFSLSSLNADDWQQGTVSILQDSQTAPLTVIPLNISAEFTGLITEANEERTYTLKEGPSKMIVPLSDANARLQVTVLNPVIDGAAGLLHFHARFLRYDRNQAQFWQVNTPVLIR